MGMSGSAGTSHTNKGKNVVMGQQETSRMRAAPRRKAAVKAKFLANATPVIVAARARRACDFVWSLERQGDVRELIAFAAGQSAEQETVT
jgi:hypothetical protein